MDEKTGFGNPGGKETTTGSSSEKKVEYDSFGRAYPEDPDSEKDSPRSKSSAKAYEKSKKKRSKKK